MSEYIPLEVQEEILKRLPVKSLIQFRLVSKSWKSLIDSPEFIAAYGARETHPNRFILRYNHTIIDGEDIDFEERYITFVDNDFIRQDFVPTVPDLIKTLWYSSVVGRSHGLLCFDGYYYKYLDGHFNKYQMVVLWNPSISKSIGIEVLYMDGLPTNNVIGFGVCPVTFDPTIVKIECFRVGIPWKVEVFTLSTGTWSILSTNLPRESISLRGSQVVVDRFIYWLAYDMLKAEDQSRYLIMSFDLIAKEFKEINLSDSLTSPLCGIQAISKLRESLVLLAYHRKFEEDLSVCWCLWMMKVQGDTISFTKLYTINLPDTTINRILGFRMTGELILEMQRDERVAEVEIYNPNSEAIDNLALFGEEYQFFMCPYMETVLLLDQLDGFIYSISH